MALAIVPVVFAVVGLLVYALSSNAKLSEIGRLLFACSFLVLMFVLAHHVIKL